MSVMEGTRGATKRGARTPEKKQKSLLTSSAKIVEKPLLTGNGRKAIEPNYITKITNLHFATTVHVSPTPGTGRVPLRLTG